MEKSRERITMGRACDGCGKHKPVIRYITMKTAMCRACLEKDLKQKKAAIKKLPTVPDLKPLLKASDKDIAWADYVFENTLTWMTH